MIGTDALMERRVKALRAFNRFYTQRIGVLDPDPGQTLGLTDVRVLYELAHCDQPTASELALSLGLDPGHLSRILRRFQERGWLERVPSIADARAHLLRLNASGHTVFAPLQQQSRDRARALLQPLQPAQQEQLLQCMGTVQALLHARPGPAALRTAILREPGPGDIGWVVQQHGEIYAREYGWDQQFEALVASIAARFVQKFQPQWERCWIAELDGERVGAVFLVRKSARVSQLRMLILSPAARGLGLGARLTDACLDFARERGYRKMVLWTNSCLLAARAIYTRRGFQLVKSEPYRGFGQDLVGETWELAL